MTPLVRSTLRVSMLSFGVPLSTMQVSLGTAAWETVAVTSTGTTASWKTPFRCVLSGIKNLDT